MKHHDVACLSWLLALSACGDPLVEVQTVQGLRILGARVEAVAESERAGLFAGDSAVLRFLVVSDQATTFDAALRVCRATPTTTGLPQCAASPFFEGETAGTVASDLTFEFALPEDFAVEAEDQWLAWVVVCEEGEPGFADDNTTRCRGGGRPVESVYRVEAGREPANLNPDLSDDELLLARDTWEVAEGPAPGQPCEADAVANGLPMVRKTRVTNARFVLGGDDRERLSAGERERYGAASHEELIFSHFLTVPGLSRPFSVMGPETEDTEFELEIAPSDDVRVPEEGTVADFYLVVRDERGGADWLRRKLCLLP